MENERYFWDLILPELVVLFRPVWGEPKSGINRRQKIATLFAMRAMRRLTAIDVLFKKGLYLESHPLVRAGYEDWIYLSYILRESRPSRCEDFEEGINKLDARVYDAFKALCGKTIADRYFKKLPEWVATFVGRPRSQTRTIPLATMADDVNLRGVHDFV